MEVTMYVVVSTLYSVHYILKIIFCTLYDDTCTLYSVLYILYIIFCTLYSVLYMMTHVRTIILTVLPSRSVADILILSLGPFKGNTLSGRSVSCMQKKE